MELDIWAKDRERYHLNLRLTSGKVDLGTIELGPAIKTYGIVVDAAGKPQVAHVLWTNLGRRTFPQPLRNNRSGSSDSKGKFELWGVGRGRYLVQARVRDKSLATKIIDIGKLGAEPFRMVLEPTYPLAVDNTKMSARRRLTLLIRDFQRRLVFACYLRGAYLIKTRLPVGIYTFEVFEDLKRVQAGSVTVGVGKGPTLLVEV